MHDGWAGGTSIRGGVHAERAGRGRRGRGGAGYIQEGWGMSNGIGNGHGASGVVGMCVGWVRGLSKRVGRIQTGWGLCDEV